MAEQEACANAVTEALAASGATGAADGNDARGESLLLPLLQGLLGGGGERLLAGLGAAGADVVADVRRSLGRLRAALSTPADHPQAQALLTLADRLEDALDAADRLDGCKRSRRRRSRAARHTVGVTHEDLERARRMADMDQLTMTEPEPVTPTTPASSVSTAPSGDEPPTPERRQSVEDEVSFHKPVEARHKPAPVVHSVSYEPPPVVNRDVPVVERRAPQPRKPDFFRHSIADTSPQQPPLPTVLPPQMRQDRRPSQSGITAIANKFNAQIEKENVPPRRAPVVRTAPVQTHISAPKVQQQKPLDNTNRTAYRPLPPTYNFAAPPPADDLSKPLNRFSGNKRARMKRANTIDIGKPLGGYKIDSDTDEDAPRRAPAPLVPELRPQTDNDRKFLAFMQRNEENCQIVNGQANWSNRFGNIKSAFETRERDDRSRSNSSSSAKRFWKTTEEQPAHHVSNGPRLSRKTYFESNADKNYKPRVPWAAERRDTVQLPPPARVPYPLSAPVSHPVPTEPTAHPLPTSISHPPAPISHPPAHISLPPAPTSHPPAPISHPPVPQSPTRPTVVKPFVAKPIPVNQFSHAPMSAFKPPKKIMSPTTTRLNIWSPPSVMNNAVSPTTEGPPAYTVSPRPFAPSPPVASVPWASDERPRRGLAHVANKFEERVSPRPAMLPVQRQYIPYEPPQAPPQQNYPVKAIASQNNLNNLSAPELVKKIDNMKPHETNGNVYPRVDAQKLQIEFYERQIREKKRHEPPPPVTQPHVPAPQPSTEHIPAPPGYTVIDYTNVSTFMPLQQTPDIEKAKAHKVDYLPDVVTMNENNQYAYPASNQQRHVVDSPNTRRVPPAFQNGVTSQTTPQFSTHVASSAPRVNVNGSMSQSSDEPGSPTEHAMPATRVMRGPVRGAATVTAGARTRTQHDAAGALHAHLTKLSSPKHEVLTQLERKRRQVGAPAPARSPADSLPSGSDHSSPALSRSSSWHHIPDSEAPRRGTGIVRTKSMHLLAVPKLYEGGIAREELVEKKKTVEAYFSGHVSPGGTTRRSHAEGIKARARGSSASNKGGAGYALGRSRTMPTVSELQFLDESNADDAFEDLVSALA